MGIVMILLLFLVFALFALFEHLKKFYLAKDMFKKIGWIAEKESNARCYSSNVNLRDEELISYLFQEEWRLEIPEDLRLDYSNESDKADAEKILNAHRNNVIEAYFSDNLFLNKKMYELNSLEYYMFSLLCFLRPGVEECKDCNKDKVYASIKYTDENYFYCQLTEYGRVYYKIYLITTMFCEKNEKTKLLLKKIDSKHIIENLRTNEIRFWTYRP